MSDQSTIDTVANLIRNGKATRIVVLAGAGMSTAAGIPDFRTPGTGLYARLQKLNLPYPEAVFDINYFRHTPEPFYALARVRHPRSLTPTLSHAFLALLARKGLLHMLFTQNIDALDVRAGIPKERMFAVHGSWATQRCMKCKVPYPDDRMMEAIKTGTVPYCPVDGCGGVVKPDTVMFGEALPSNFETEEQKVGEADLMLIMGTSLKVHPAARLPGRAAEGVPRVLINLDKAGDIGKRPDDMFILGKCDEGVQKLADALGWREELETLWKEISTKEDEQVDVSKELDAAIEQLSNVMKESRQVSTGHKKMLENHLESKFAGLLSKKQSSG
ncbi:hypothetical protein ASPWEDRAFT_116288 [Aspergillus wentii DTO 134E9]|uniref:NAD-dependent protein deacetylase n=1 Tax=Aspergillus wentii DTO 134E9 TaxID=1073089 RepID=A0A1L9REK9_ASPWE|nr:uncharacterized protein ASPWEDRAFT_116288 [Aspergillus wentii DTO 134E9]OJJ33303.1 hypothetical protein ASPWEDRAFT_116288 [Aspergillus wentii DTO 134E9]